MLILIAASLTTTGCALECSKGMKPINEVIKGESDGSATAESNSNSGVTKKVSASAKANRELTCKSAD
jgi:hypothetical protein